MGYKGLKSRCKRLNEREMNSCGRQYLEVSFFTWWIFLPDKIISNFKFTVEYTLLYE
jgi:hypothetical protein